MATRATSTQSTTSQPGLIEVVLGEAWDLTATNADEDITGDMVGNTLNSVKVKWSEPIKESLVDASRFFIDGSSALTATVVTGVPDTV
jgi:hypothetical protein